MDTSRRLYGVWVAAAVAVLTAPVPVLADSWNGVTDAQFSAAARFVGYYQRNSVFTKKVCADAGVDVSAYDDAFRAEHADGLARANRILMARGFSDEKQATSFKERETKFYAAAEDDMRRLASGTGKKGTKDGCKLVVEASKELAEGRLFATTEPEQWKVLMAQDVPCYKLAQPATPPYPPVAVHRREEGTVLMNVTVDIAQGTAIETHLEKSSGSASLDAVTVARSKDWHFDTSTCPLGKDQTTYKILVPIVFSLGLDKTS